MHLIIRRLGEAKNQRVEAKGFTLIELMIVIAIIAIIAAIAIPGLLQSQRASNERNASASLKTLATANSDFRSNDRDENRLQDFWTLDVAGLYTVFPAGSTSSSAIKLIEISVAGADAFNSGTQAASTATTSTSAGPGSTIISSFIRSSPKAGYWFYALESDCTSGTNASYVIDTDGTGRRWHNNTGFGFGAYPDSFSSGRNIFIINEGNTMFKRQIIGTVKTTTAVPPAAYPLTSGLPTGSSPATIWPSDTSLKADYGKMD